MMESDAKGIVSAGSTQTAEAGIEVLRNGGNAVDAAVAAAFAVSAGEPTVTSLGGAGMMMVYSANSETLQAFDFFANAPLMKPSEQPKLDFFGIDLDYGPTQQTFFVGRGSAAVPGIIPGLGMVHHTLGSQPFESLLEPAIRQLRNGVTLGPRQRAMGEFLEPILTRQPEPRKWFSTEEGYLSEDAKFVLPELADTLTEMQNLGWRRFYDTILVPQMLEDFGPHNGGLLQPADFERYEPVLRTPTKTTFFDHNIYTVPSPAAGGPMIALMLSLLNQDNLRMLSSDALIKVLCAAQETADYARMRHISGQDALSKSAEIAAFEARCDSLEGTQKLVGGPASTTHISVVDAAGNAVAVTLSHGESNTYNIGQTGIMMNNFLGESDLLPQGFGTAETGARLATMMSPTIALGPSGRIIALGTGGANRIRSAILQSLWHLIAANKTPRAAIDAPRLHYEDGILNIESFDRDVNFEALRRHIPEAVTLFDEPNLYFGGINCATRSQAGRLDGAGDPRRGGVCLIA